MVITKKGNCWGVHSWATGFQYQEPERSLKGEFDCHPEAVLNRLMREEQWEEAEELLDLF